MEGGKWGRGAVLGHDGFGGRRHRGIDGGGRESWRGRMVVGLLLPQSLGNQPGEFHIMVGNILGGLDCSLVELPKLIELDGLCDKS